MWIFIDLCVFYCMSCFLGVVASRYIYVNMYRSMCSLLPGMFFWEWWPRGICMWIFIDLCVSTDWSVFLEWWPRDIDMQIFINLCVSQCLEVFLSCDIEVYLCIYLYKYRGKQIVGAKPRFFFLSGGLDSVLLIVGVCVCFGVVTSICIYIYKCVVLFELFCSGLVTSMYLCIYIYIYVCFTVWSFVLEWWPRGIYIYIYIYVFLEWWPLFSFFFSGFGEWWPRGVYLYIYTYLYIYIYVLLIGVFVFVFGVMTSRYL